MVYPEDLNKWYSLPVVMSTLKDQQSLPSFWVTHNDRSVNLLEIRELGFNLTVSRILELLTALSKKFTKCIR